MDCKFLWQCRSFSAFVLTIVVKAIISIVTPEYGTVASVIQSIVALVLMARTFYSTFRQKH